MKKPLNVICLMGPTATGKTNMAIALAERLPCDIISVDSVMVYRGLDVGSAKPSSDVLAKTPHRLVDCCEPSEPYSAAQFCEDATHEIDTIVAKGRIPLLVGGTMLYFHALQNGLASLPDANPLLRQQLSDEAEKIGWAAMHDKLKTIDPIAAARIKPQDTQRIQRALEIYRLTGQAMSAFLDKQKQPLLPYQFINIALAPKERTRLHERIEQRLAVMWDAGLIEEVKKLKERGDLNAALPALRAVGYRQVWSYLAGELPQSELHPKTLVATRQLAKRQLTWLRRWPEVTWFDSDDPELELQLTSFVLQKIEQ